ncbi:hypothetical protein BH23PAT1_BH23PAT1_4210 [soil metagenome]
MYRVIFEHHPKKGQEDAFIKQWKIGSDIIQTYPGARGTKLFRSLDNPKILYAMAEWESKAARDAAVAELEKRKDAEWLLHAHEKFVIKHSAIVSAELIGESAPPDS